jgi:hypothetical protein
MKLTMAFSAAALLALATFSVGCGNACDDAADKLEECGVPAASEGEGECTEAAEKIAQCVIDAECDVITGKSKDAKAIKAYGDCILGK